MVVTALSQTDLEIHLGALNFSLLVVHSLWKSSEKGDNICAYFAHLVISVIHELNWVRYERFRLQLPSVTSGAHLLLNHTLIRLSLFKCRSIVRQQIKQVGFNRVNLFRVIFQIFSNLVHNTVKDYPRFVCELPKLVLFGLDAFFGEIVWSLVVDLLDKLHAWSIKHHLFFFELLEKLNSSLRVNHLFAVHADQETFNCVLLMQFFESCQLFGPDSKMFLKNGIIIGDHLLVECVTFSVLSLVSLLILHLVVNKELIYFRLQHERNVDQVFAKFVQKTARTALLKIDKAVKICPQLITVRLASLLKTIHLVPNTLHVVNLVG